jgi:uncharacterized membrane protein YhaH (DUF805 family)
VARQSRCIAIRTFYFQEHHLSNIYAAPVTDLSKLDQTAETSMFSFDGRIGRVRVIAYSCAMHLLSVLGMCIVAFLVELSKGLRQFVIWVPLLTLGITLFWMCVFARRRLQDLNLRPVWMLAGFIPLVNLYLLFLMVFKRGDDGSNDYGLPPAPNTPGMEAMAAIVPTILVLGLVAVIASKH